MSTSYPSNLTQAQWELLIGLIPAAKPGGRPCRVDMQAVVNAILYILCAGCAWRMLPSDFPCWKTVYHYFRVQRVNGTQERINHKLHQWVRVSFVTDTYHPIGEPVLQKDAIKGFVPVPQQWKVERTFGWFNWCRRLSKDYEVLPQTSEAFIYVANIRIMLHRLAQYTSQASSKLARNLPHDVIVQNTRALARTAKEAGVPLILTSSMETQFQGLLLDDLQTIAPEVYEQRVRRPGMVDCWEYEDYKQAMETRGRKKLIMAGLTNDVCIVYPAISAVEDGYGVQVVVGCWWIGNNAGR